MTHLEIVDTKRSSKQEKTVADFVVDKLRYGMRDSDSNHIEEQMDRMFQVIGMICEVLATHDVSLEEPMLDIFRDRVPSSMIITYK